jgi:hypothetical protein
MTQVPKRPDVGDDKRYAELILRAHLPQIDAAVFDSQAAAATVVTELSDLVLQRLIFEVVADTSDEIKALAGFTPIADERANLVRKRLLEVRRRGRRIIVQPEVGSSDEKLSIRPYLQERPMVTSLWICGSYCRICSRS